MMRSIVPFPAALLLASGLALAACSKSSEIPQEPATNLAEPAPVNDSLANVSEAPPVENLAEAAPADGNTVGGDGSQITLNGLTEADLAATPLEGELACSFTRPGERQPLLIAKGDVGSKGAAQGVVKVMGYVERIAAPGGFDGLLKGPSFTGQGKTIRISLTGAATGGGESPPRPAMMVYDRADGAQRAFSGDWTCGP